MLKNIYYTKPAKLWDYLRKRSQLKDDNIFNTDEYVSFSGSDTIKRIFNN